MVLIHIVAIFLCRFPNHSSKVFSGVVENFPAMIVGMMKVQEEGSAADASQNQKKKLTNVLVSRHWCSTFCSSLLCVVSATSTDSTA